jgi:hypothetical protein
MDLDSDKTTNGSNGRLSVPFAEAAGVTPPMASTGKRGGHKLMSATRAFLLNEIQQRHIDSVAKDLRTLSGKQLGACKSQLRKLVDHPTASWNSTSRNLFAALHKLYADQKKATEAPRPASALPKAVDIPFLGILTQPKRKVGRPLGDKNKPKDDALSIRRPRASDMAKMMAELEKTRSEIEVLKETVASLTARSAHASPAALAAMSEYDRRYEAIMRFIEQSKEPVTMPKIRASIPETFSATKKILEKGVRLKRIKEVTNPWTHILEYWRVAL